MHTARIGATIATALLLSNVAGKPVSAAAPSTTLRFALPGGAAILYSKALDPQTPLSQRSWQQAVFHLPNGTKFRLQPRSGESDSDGTQMEPPSDSNISPSGYRQSRFVPAVPLSYTRNIRPESIQISTRPRLISNCAGSVTVPRQSSSERSRHKVVGRKSSRSSIDPMRSLSWRAGVQMQPARISTGTSIRSVHFVLRRSASRLGSRRCWPSRRRLAMATMACLMEDVSGFPTRMLHRSVHA